MATVVTTNKAASVRNARKPERPRPLKASLSEATIEKINPSSSTFESVPAKKSPVSDDVIKELAALNLTITNGNYDKNTNAAVVKLCSQLKFWGQQLEEKYKEQLDRYFETLRNASRSELLGLHARTHLLEVIELRAKAWKNDTMLETYYKQKLSDISNMQPGFFGTASGLMTSATLPATFNPNQPPILSPTHILSHSSSQATLSPGEVLKNSGKFPHPTKIPGKNFLKDEVIIRNSDSGKVMGIKGRRVHMIEELSDTVISFQRVGPGTRDRLVQIIGPQAENIDSAKLLIEDTIRRNASPIREMPEMGIAGLVASDSSTSLNSTASEESLGSNRYQHSTQNALYQGTSSSSLVTNATELAGCPIATQENKRKLLIHSHSMSDTTIGEYSYTVNVGTDVLKISGTKAELVNKAKLVLEEFFAGEAELEKKQRDQENALTATLIKASSSTLGLKQAHQSFHLMSEQYPSNVYSRGSEVKAAALIRGNSSGSNGSGSNGLPATSSSEEEHTVKGGESSPDEENTAQNRVSFQPMQHTELRRSTSVSGSKFSFQNLPNAVSQNQSGATVTVVRQPIFPNSKPEDIMRTEEMMDPASLAAKNRRANFSQKNSSGDSSSKEDISSHDRQLRSRSKSSPELEYSMGVPKSQNESRICYTRQFLLDCAKSPLCKKLPVQPEMFLDQAQAHNILRSEPIKYFDPATFPVPGPTTSRWKNSVSPPKSESFDSGL